MAFFTGGTKSLSYKIIELKAVISSEELYVAAGAKIVLVMTIDTLTVNMAFILCHTHLTVMIMERMGKSDSHWKHNGNSQKKSIYSY